MLDLVIIGAGPIGLYSSFIAGAKKLKTVTIESLSYIGGQLTTLYPEKPIYDVAGIPCLKAKELINELYKQYLPFKKEVPIKLNTSLRSIEKKDDHYIVITNNEELITKTILITTGNGGFIPRKMGLEYEDEITNIAYNIIDTNKYKNKKVIIMGGGDSALDYGNMLENIAKDITIIHRRNDFRASEDSVEKFKIHGNLLTPYSPKKLIVENTLGKALILINNESNKEKSISFDEIIVTYGMLPSSFDFSKLGIETKKDGIMVKTNMETSLKHVFAVGNSIYYEGKIKTLACGFGEAAIALHTIETIINPQKSNLPGFIHLSRS